MPVSIPAEAATSDPSELRVHAGSAAAAAIRESFVLPAIQGPSVGAGVIQPGERPPLAAEHIRGTP